MASDAGLVEYICEQLRGVGGISARRMFGEYAIYAGRKVVALVADDRLFLKPTKAGRALLVTPAEAPPYPGASMYFVLDDHVDDADFLATLVRATESELPEPAPQKPKKPKKPKNPGKPEAG